MVNEIEFLIQNYLTLHSIPLYDKNVGKQGLFRHMGGFIEIYEHSGDAVFCIHLWLRKKASFNLPLTTNCSCGSCKVSADIKSNKHASTESEVQHTAVQRPSYLLKLNLNIGWPHSTHSLIQTRRNQIILEHQINFFMWKTLTGACLSLQILRILGFRTTVR